MKKIVFVLILICVIIGAAFAQAKPAAPAPAKPAASSAASGKLNAAGLDVFQLVRGVIESDSDNDFSIFNVFAGYERLIAPHFTIGAALDMSFVNYKIGNDKKSNNYFCLAAEGRYYPMSTGFEKLFLGTTLGYSQYSVDGSTKTENGGFTGLCASLKMGYKVLTDKGFYLEPALSYTVDKGKGIVRDTEWDVGLRLGWAF